MCAVGPGREASTLRMGVPSRGSPGVAETRALIGTETLPVPRARVLRFLRRWEGDVQAAAVVWWSRIACKERSPG